MITNEYRTSVVSSQKRLLSLPTKRAARGDRVPFLSSQSHAAHPTRPSIKSAQQRGRIGSWQLSRSTCRLDHLPSGGGSNCKDAVPSPRSLSGKSAQDANLGGAFLRICATQSKQRTAVNSENLHTALQRT